MTKTDGFMDPGSYDAATFAAFVQAIIGNGYRHGYLNGLAVSAQTPNIMAVNVATGGAILNGGWVKSDAVTALSIDAADATLDRIDRIICRKTGTTKIEILVLKGTAAASPAAPTLATDGTEISLATVLVTHGITAIAGTGTSLITDERLTDACGPAACELGLAFIDTDGALDMASLQIHHLADPTGDQDADTKAARNAALAAYIPAGSLIGITTLASGSGTFTTSANTTKLKIRMLGAGGGSGGVKAAGGAESGPGGCGAYLEKFVTVSPSTGYAYAVGAAGAAGTNAPTNGGAGGNSTLTVGGTTYTAGGGSGSEGKSTRVTPAPGGAVGTATNGDINVSGLAGKNTIYLTGGDLGSSHAPTLGGATYGAGAEGVSSTDSAGNAGKVGLIIIEEYA